MLDCISYAESYRASSFEVEKAWHLVSVLMRLGRPASPEELASRCFLFYASADVVKFLCSIPGSPIALNQDLFVTISFEVVLSAFSVFASNEFPSFVPRIRAMARVSWPKRSWDDCLQTYCRKRKGEKNNFLIHPTAKRRLLSIIEENDNQRHPLCSDVKIEISYPKENDTIKDYRIGDVGFPSFELPVTKYITGVFEQESTTPCMDHVSNSLHTSYGIKILEQEDANKIQIKFIGTETGRVPATHIKDYEYDFPRIDIDLNQKLMTDDTLMENESEDELAPVTVALQESLCEPCNAHPPEEDAESVLPHDYGVQVVGLLETETKCADAVVCTEHAIAEAVIPVNYVPENEINCADEVVCKEQAASEALIPVNSQSDKLNISKRLQMNFAARREPLEALTLSRDFQVILKSFNNEKLITSVKRHEQDKKDEKSNFKKHKSRCNRNNNARLIQQRVDNVHKASKNILEPKALPNFESFIAEEEEGSGGYGTVYKARRRSDGKIFAVKCPHVNADTRHVYNELKMLERFGGRNFVIKYEGSFKSGNSECFVLEHVEHDRPEVLKREINIFELQWYGYCMFKALASLHKQGIVHRDVKPGNFLFSRKLAKGYLIDFNLALDLNQEYCSSGNSVMKVTGNFGELPRPDKKIHTAKVRKAAHGVPLKPIRNKASRTSLLAHDKKRVDGAHFQTFSKINKLKNESQGADASGMNSTKEGTSTRTLSGEAIRQPIKTKGREELFSLLNDAKQGLNHESVSAPASQRKRVAAPIGNLERRLFYLSPMPLRSSSVAVAGDGRPKSKGDQKPKKDGTCVGTKGFRAPEVLFKSAYQGPKVDVWSAGVTMLYLMIGRTPFTGDLAQNVKEIAMLRGSEDLWELARLHKRESSFPEDLFDIQSLPSIELRVWCEQNTRRPGFCEAIPSSLIDLVDKCLTVNPRLRISAEEALNHEFFDPCYEAFRKHRLKKSLSSDCGVPNNGTKTVKSSACPLSPTH